MDTVGLRMKRAIVELRYDPVLPYRTLRENLFDPLMKNFTTLKMTNISMELINEDLHYKIFSESSRSGMYFENIKNHEEYIDMTARYLSQVLKGYGREELRRIGNRYYWLLPYKGSFEDLFARMKADIYKEPINVFGEILDLGVFGLTAKDGNYKININVGPVRKKELTSQNEFNYDDDPEAGILVDIDMYSDVKLKYPVKPFLETAYNNSRIKCLKFLESIKEGK